MFVAEIVLLYRRFTLDNIFLVVLDLILREEDAVVSDELGGLWCSASL